ncbi:MAG: alpha,alpha-trehalose-phosphate synthase (UDP-forming) [Dichotomicrobium sp.]
MKRLVVVSNRVADWTSGGKSGGLAVALQDALKMHGGLWLGWSGKIVGDDAPCELTQEHHGSVTLATMPLTKSQYQNYYLGFSNNVLWPVFHYRLDIARFEPEYWESYVATARRFARELVGLLAPDDVVWVHDYHLIPLAAELRALGVDHKIGFFLHIPFPSPDVLAAAPQHRELVRALFDYDLVGLQTHADVGNFGRFVYEASEGTVLPDGRLRLDGKTVLAKSFPIGIDVDSFRAMARTEEADRHIETLQRRTIASAFIMGVDRLDYTKGIAERFRAFQRLIENYPHYRTSVTLMQIAPPTREEVLAYAEMRQELEQLSGHINGELGNYDWTPVRYIHRHVPRNTLAALLRGSQVGLVTPLRDGMNLVAKEYVAAQDDENPGVLILSRFAGAAEEMKEALIINPYDIDEMVEAMHRALSMPLKERKERHQALLERVSENDISRWRQTFLETLDKVGREASA